MTHERSEAQDPQTPEHNRIRVAFDARMVRNQMTGIGRYSLDLLRGFAAARIPARIAVLVATDAMKKLIQSKARVAEMVKVAKDEGMTTLVQDGVLKSFDGIMDLKQVKAVALK